MHYKYKLNHLLSLLPAGIYPESIIAHLEVIHRIYSHVFNRDRYISLEDEEEIPYERLLIYAQVFGVGIDDLITKKAALF